MGAVDLTFRKVKDINQQQALYSKLFAALCKISIKVDR